MTTVAAVKYEFRCSTCYQVLHAPVEEAGHECECCWCQNMTRAPEATPERIAEAANADLSDNLSPGMFAAGKRLSVEEIETLARQRAIEHESHDDNGRCRNPSQSSASRFSRLLAVIADGMISIMVGALGAVTVPVAVFLGVLDVKHCRQRRCSSSSLEKRPRQVSGQGCRFRLRPGLSF